jgi:hypothetical protein
VASSARARTSWTLASVAAAVLLRVPLVFVPLRYHEDIWRQADTASIAHHFLVNGFRILYPQISWGGNGPGYVEAEFQLFPWLTALAYDVLGEHTWIGRAVALAFTAAAMFAFWRIAHELIEPVAARAAFAVFALSPLLIRYGTAFMPEAAALCFYLTALWLFLRWLASDDTNTLAWCAAATAAAILVKPTTINIGLVFAALVVVRRGWRGLLEKRLVLLGAASLLPAALWYAHARDLYLTYGNTFGVLAGGDSKFSDLRELRSPGTYLGIAKLDLLWSLSIVLVVPAVVGVVACWRHRRGHDVVLIGIGVNLLYEIAVGHYANNASGIQYHVYLLPFLALASGIGIATMIAGARDRPAAVRRAAHAGIGAVVVASLAVSAYAYLGQFRQGGDELVRCGEAIAADTALHDLIVVSSSTPSVVDGRANNYEEPMLFFYSDREGWSIASDQLSAAAIEDYRAQGARYFVADSAPVLEAGSGAEAWLDGNARQVGPGLDEGCGIWKL